MPDKWLPVWSALSDQALEKRLRYYLWLSIAVPHTHDRRIAQLIAEAERRGKREIVDHAKEWVAANKAAPLL